MSASFEDKLNKLIPDSLLIDMEELRQNRDSIIYKHAKKADFINSKVFGLLQNAASKEDDTKAKGGTSLTGILHAMITIERKKSSPMSGKELLESEKELLEYAIKTRDMLGADPAYKMQLDDINTEINRYRNDLDAIKVELSKTTNEEQKKLLEEKYTLIESKK
jgi:hypothetical protein